MDCQRWLTWNNRDVKWRRRLLWGLVVCGLVFVAILAWPKNEPRYGGRYLSAWLQDCCRAKYYSADTDSPWRARAEEAVRHIGTNALPYLLEGLHYERPAWMNKVSRAAATVRSPRFNLWWAGVLRDHDRGTQASVGFEVLGAQAAPAIPVLIGLLDDRGSRAPAAILGEMGRVALPQLLSVLTNRSFDVHQRADAAWAIECMETNASDTVEVLKGCLNDEPVVAGAAASALPEVTTNRSLFICALTNALVSPSAELRSDLLDALGECGAEALPVIDAVRARLVDENVDVRSSATNALMMILDTPGQMR